MSTCTTTTTTTVRKSLLSRLARKPFSSPYAAAYAARQRARVERKLKKTAVQPSSSPQPPQSEWENESDEDLSTWRWVAPERSPSLPKLWRMEREREHLQEHLQYPFIMDSPGPPAYCSGSGTLQCDCEYCVSTFFRPFDLSLQ